MKSGLVSISFRKLSWQATLALAKKAGLEGIEWGGDVHVPHGNIELAREVGEATRAAGLAVAAYGSYYRLGEATPAFCDVLASAKALGAPIIRIWAGHRDSCAYSEEERQALIAEANEVTALAKAEGIGIVFEYHGRTLTDTADSCARLLEAVPEGNSYWQPPVSMNSEDCMAGLIRLGSRVAGVHVFSWEVTDRLPLIAREHDWPGFLAQAKAQGAPWALMEFVKDDKPEQLMEDAAVLNRWLSAIKEA